MNTEHFKEKLEAEAKALEHGIAENSDAPRTQDQSATEKDELADKIEDMEEEKGENVALKARLLEVRAALGRIDAGTYGVCEVSGEKIEEDRLEANPAARTCKMHMGGGSELA